MISSIRCPILILLSFHLVHGSVTVKKRKTPHSPQKTTNNLERAQSESDTPEDPLDHQAKRQAIGSVENNSSFSLDNGTETISSESSSTSSSTSLRQSILQPNGRVSASRTKKNTSTVLRDTTNTVEVQPVGVPAMMQAISQQQEVPQAENITLVPFKMTVKGGQFYHFHPVNDFHEWIALKNPPLQPFAIIFGDLVTSFQLSRTSDTLSVILSFIVPISGRIGVRLVGFKKPYDKTKQRFVPSAFLNEPLVNGMALPLCKFKNISALARNSQYIYLQIEISFESGHHDVMIGVNVLEQIELREIQRVSKLIEQLLHDKQYEEVEELVDDLTRDTFSKCLFPAISTLEHCENLAEYLRRKQMMTDFFVYGNLGVIEQFIEKNDYTEDDFIDGGDLEVALYPLFEGGHYERFVDLLEVRRQVTADTDFEHFQCGLIPSFEGFLRYFFDGFKFHDGMSIERFFDNHEVLNNKCPEVMESFCGELVCALKKNNNPASDRLLDDLVRQPPLLTPTAFCYGFLYGEGDGGKARDEDLVYFVEHGWKESIREGLEGRYAFGGKDLWEVMVSRFPDKCSGDLPRNNESLEAVCSKFPTKRQLEKRWVKRNASTFLARIETAAPVLDLLPKVLWIIISQYAITWHDIE